MPASTVVGFSGNFTRPSKTRGFVGQVVNELATRYGLEPSLQDIVDVGPSLGAARWENELDAQARSVVQRITEASVLVIGSPTFKGSYTGLFKHFFDLIDPLALKGKPVALLATGGGERHALVIEHQLRPLFGFFETLTLPTAIYASEKDFEDGELTSPAIKARLAQTVEEAGAALRLRPKLSIAAE